MSSPPLPLKSSIKVPPFHWIGLEIQAAYLNTIGKNSLVISLFRTLRISDGMVSTPSAVPDLARLNAAQVSKKDGITFRGMSVPQSSVNDCQCLALEELTRSGKAATSPT